MLTIILKILGILGILLLALLGVVVALLLLVLFVPVAYSVRADRRAVLEGSPPQGGTEDAPGEYLLRVAAKADWLLGFLRVRFFYPEPGTVTVKVLFFKLFDSGKAKEEETEEEERTSRSKASKSQKSKKAAPAKVKKSTVEADEFKTIEAKKNEAEAEESHTTDSEPSEEGDTRQEEKSPKRNPKRITLEKIQYTFRKICDRIKEICGKIKDARNHAEYYKEILLSEDAKGLLNHAFMRFGKILKSIRPRKLRADIRFGTGAPDTTGYVFGIYGILCSYLGQNVILTPDFERAVLTGELYAAGHVTIFKLLWHFLRIVLDKRLWKLYSKLKEG